MASTSATSRLRQLWAAALAAGVCGLLFLYIQYRIDPTLLYHRQGPVFYFGKPFYQGFLDRPGGLAEYAASFLAQFLAIRWAGAMVMTGLAAAVCLAIAAILARVRTGPAAGWPVLPAILLILPYHRYNQPLDPAVALAAALAVTGLYLWMAPRNTLLRAALFAAVAAALYWAAGAAELVLAGVAGLYEWLRIGEHPAESSRPPRRLLPGLAILILGAAVPVVIGSGAYDLGFREAYTRLLPFDPSGGRAALAAWIALFACIPAAMLLARLWPTPAEPPATPAPAKPNKAGNPPAPARAWPQAFRQLAPRLAAPLACVVVAAGLAADPLRTDDRTLLAVDLAATEGRWQDVLDIARTLPRWNRHVADQTVRALQHTGHLGSDLFTYPQGRGVEVLSDDMTVFYSRTYPLRLSLWLFDVGLVNRAEHMACEALEVAGERPATLQHLARIHIVKGETDAARVYLGALEKTLWHADWARDMARRLQADPQAAGDAELRETRGRLWPADFVAEFQPEAELQRLLDANPRNRAAFEHLMTLYLHSGRPDLALAALVRIRADVYPDLPRHWEEAIALWARKAGRLPPDLGGRTLRPETVRRCGEFLQILNNHRSSPQAAWNALKTDYGDTFWFFFAFGRSAADGSPDEDPPPPATAAPDPEAKP